MTEINIYYKISPDRKQPFVFLVMPCNWQAKPDYPSHCHLVVEKIVLFELLVGINIFFFYLLATVGHG